MRIETTILKNLIYNEEYTRKVVPFLSEEYFKDHAEKLVFKEIQDFITKYNTPPTYEALLVQLDERNVSQEDHDRSIEIIDQINETKDDLGKIDWLLDKTEKFCQDQAIYNGVLESISILDGSHKTLDKGAIPELLTKALSVGFDTTIGQEYLADALSQYEYYHLVENKLSLDIEYFNKITNGGFPPKTLNIFVAGCVDENTKVKIRAEKEDWDEIETEIKNIKYYLSGDDRVDIDSPDGWVPVIEFVEKGRWLGYKVSFDDTYIIVNEDHLFETKNGWEFTKNLIGNCEILSRNNEYKSCFIERLHELYNIVDVQIGHENHRYFAGELSSHNTNVGKSTIKCHFASHFLSMGKNVLYISLEMSEQEIAKRIDANLLNVAMDELDKLSKEVYLQKRNKLMNNVTGKLIIKEYPTSSASVATFRLLLNELLLKRNFKPDVIFIDYMNICASSRLKMSNTVNSYTYIKSIAEELRGLAVEFNVPIITSSQLNRNSSTNSDPEIDGISESQGTAYTADFICAVISNEELESMNQILVKQLKSRYKDKGQNKRFVVGIDRAKARLYNVESYAQDDLVDSGQVSTNSASSSKRSFDEFKFD